MYIQYNESYDFLDKNDFVFSSITYPKNNSIVYISKKIETELQKLVTYERCFVFLQEGIDVPENIEKKHFICVVENPSAAFGKYLKYKHKTVDAKNRKRKYTRHKEGYILGENVAIGEGTIIEYGAFIDHDVQIGCNCIIHAGAMVRDAKIGDNCEIFEYAIIGNKPFNMYCDNGIRYRMPAIGKVILGDYVSIGANTVVDKGTASDTLIEKNVKIDVNCQIGHDAIIHQDVLVTGGSVVGGFSEIGKGTNVYHSFILKRLRIGENSEILVNSCVLKDVKEKAKVMGYPARVIG